LTHNIFIISLNYLFQTSSGHKSVKVIFGCFKKQESVVVNMVLCLAVVSGAPAAGPAAGPARPVHGGRAGAGAVRAAVGHGRPG